MNSAPASILARWYHVDTDGDGGVDVRLVEAPLHGIAVVEGQIVGRDVVVSTRAVLVESGEDGMLRGCAPPPLMVRDDTLCFDPAKGGVRTRDNRRARGAFNHLVAEANQFGMVNAYVHTERAMVFLNRLIGEAGGLALPPLGVVTGAHFGSRLSGYGEGDGDRRSGELRPLSGGHYRLSTRTSGVPELEAVAATGEVHLGCSRYRKPYAGWTSYLRNAAHNPAIIYHEAGHHLCRHTADFRVNAERLPDEQRNGKTGIEEGVCDYFAAALLGSGRPYGWYRADRGSRRDPELGRHLLDREAPHDAHSEGAVWAAAWWRARSHLVEHGLLPAGVDHDRCLVEALSEIGTITGPAGTSRRRRERRRTRPSTMIRAYLDTLHQAGGAAAVGAAERIFEAAGLRSVPNRRTMSGAEVSSC